MMFEVGDCKSGAPIPIARLADRARIQQIFYFVLDFQRESELAWHRPGTYHRDFITMKREAALDMRVAEERDLSGRAD